MIDYGDELIDEDSGYWLPKVAFDPKERTLVVKFEGTEYDWFTMPVKLGKRQEAQIRQYVEDMIKAGKVLER